MTLRSLLLGLAAAVALAMGAAPAHAITFGTLDTTGRYPQVGALVGELEGQAGTFCTGTLVAPAVMVTAAHCTAAIDEIGITGFSVTFDPTFGPDSPRIPATYVEHPRFPGPQSNRYDLAVVKLATPVHGVPYATLPAAGLLDRLGLRSQRFVAVGYGAVRETKRKGPQALDPGGDRRYVEQGVLSITRAWLHLSMNPSTGSGGTCYGDSGGPHFLKGSLTLVSITVTGDAPCRATDVTYRLDTPWSRQFLAPHVPLGS